MTSSHIEEISSARPTRSPRGFCFLLLLVLCTLSGPARAQSLTTASRLGDLQIGGGYVFGNSTYNFNKSSLRGIALYTTFDARNHWGFEGSFRQTKPSDDSTVYERTYEIGPRLYLTHGRLAPYAKVLFGRGVYNFHNDDANIAYNLYTYGGGADFTVTPRLNLRIDYEYQNWLGFPIKTLNPSLVTIGVAYHFPKERKTH